MRSAALVFGIFATLATVSACATQGGTAWVEAVNDPHFAGDNHAAVDVDPLTVAEPPLDPAEAGFPPLPVDATCAKGEGCDEGAIVVRDYGSGARAVIENALPADLFRNTYYDFPVEAAGKKDATLYDAACKAIAQVPRDFHDRVCVQGSGKLASGRTVSFAKRGCDCADVCPRTGQKICFEALDPAKFPSGRGATGKPITPLKTIAVDSTVIPLGTPVYVADFVGLPRPDGTKHDGCFLAEDRGTRVIGRQIDVFTGDPSVTAQWNKLVPSNHGVRVSMNDPKCPKAP
jgi:3D (Asp-Asp-Asp) domain-containing protein